MIKIKIAEKQNDTGNRRTHGYMARCFRCRTVRHSCHILMEHSSFTAPASSYALGVNSRNAFTALELLNVDNNDPEWCYPALKPFVKSVLYNMVFVDSISDFPVFLDSSLVFYADFVSGCPGKSLSLDIYQIMGRSVMARLMTNRGVGMMLCINPGRTSRGQYLLSVDFYNERPGQEICGHRAAGQNAFGRMQKDGLRISGWKASISCRSTALYLTGCLL